MSQSVSSRHEGDLKKQLLPFGESKKIKITLLLDHSAKSVAVQHTAWMLANLAVRLDGYVEEVSVCGPSGLHLQPNVIPTQHDGSDLIGALVGAASSLGIVPVVANQMVGMVFHIGPGSDPKGGWRVCGNGWIGGIKRSRVTIEQESPLPFGPYIAACFATAEIFKDRRMLPQNYSPTEGFFDAWSLQPVRDFRSNEMPNLPAMELECTLAGVGAVGTAFLHAMFGCPKLKLSADIADNDKKGLDITNLNRYVLFGKSSIGKLKPNAVCELLKNSQMQLRPWNDSVETLPKIGNRVLSAVDRNKSREGIQYKSPSRIISASTCDLRAEVLRCGPPGEGACLRCYNVPEVLPSDDDEIARLKKATAEEFAQYCGEAGISIEDGKAWVNERKCGQAGERLLTVLRTTDEEQGVFSVGFTSVFAGTLLAVEFIKDCMGVANALNGQHNHFTFQFFDVLSTANEVSFLPVDPNCPSCHAKALSIWKQRFNSLDPKR